jgi:hypothetical protein
MTVPTSVGTNLRTRPSQIALTLRALIESETIVFSFSTNDQSHQLVSQPNAFTPGNRPPASINSSSSSSTSPRVNHVFVSESHNLGGPTGRPRPGEFFDRSDPATDPNIFNLNV